jgi:hypothetical protein
MKKTFETLSLVTLAFVVVFGVFAWYIKATILPTPQDSHSTSVLGAEATPSNVIEISKKNMLEIDTNLVSLSSVLRFENVLYFDNGQREYFEGITIPNSEITLILGDQINRITTDPNGFFSIAIPDNIEQFSEGELIIFNQKNEVSGGYRFIFVLKEFGEESYFYNPKEKIAYSLSMPISYISSREDPYTLSNTLCSATVRQDISKTSFDFVQNQNLLIFPTDIVSLDFAENKYVAIDIESDAEEKVACFEEWRKIGPTLRWHDFLNSFDPIEVSDTISPISSPIFENN